MVSRANFGDYAPVTNMIVKVGPIIGKVTHSTARIAAEFNKVAEVKCFLLCEDGTGKCASLMSRANIPVVFKFKGLSPKTFYRVYFDCESYVSSSFWTLRRDDDDPGRLNVAIVSCNEISQQDNKPREADLWKSLGSLADAHKLDYIFHIGDQCYMDMGKEGQEHTFPYQRCKEILRETPKQAWEFIKPQLLEILRDQYRKTWTYPSVRYALANVPNLTICDDHEFRDDWGFKKDDYKPGSLEHFYGEVARQVYYEYQRQLREDLPKTNSRSSLYEYHYHVFHGVGVVFMEYRGCRSWFRENKLEETHIGENQFRWITELFRKQGEFDKLKVKSALFISPLPLFFLSHFISFFGGLLFPSFDDIREHWTYKSTEQLVELLDILREWKERVNGRKLLVVGGDVHLGGWSVLCYQKIPLFTQFISSGINSEEIGPYKKNGLNWLQQWGEVNDDYDFKHQNWTRKNNYGIVEIRNINGFSTIRSSLVYFENGRMMMESYQNI